LSKTKPYQFSSLRRSVRAFSRGGCHSACALRGPGGYSKDWDVWPVGVKYDDATTWRPIYRWLPAGRSVAVHTAWATVSRQNRERQNRETVIGLQA